MIAEYASYFQFAGLEADPMNLLDVWIGIIDWLASIDGDKKPHNYVEKQTDGRPQRNFGDFNVKVPIKDIRGKDSE